MKQLTLELAVESVPELPIPLDTVIQQEVVTRMAAAILAVHQGAGGKRDEEDSDAS